MFPTICQIFFSVIVKAMLAIEMLFASHVVQLCFASLIQEEIAIFRSNDFTIQDNGDSWIIGHHGLPEHGFEGGFGNNPNTPSTQNHSYEIPKIPSETTAGEENCVNLGAIAMAISGAAFYNPYTGGGYNAVEGECEEDFDHCNGHPSPDGMYHYHQLPKCLYYNNTDLRDVFLGVAFDGYPIYGPMDETGKNWTTAELDKCHGHVYKGRYMYRITFDFPYIMSCYHGSLLFTQGPQMGGGGWGPPGGGGMGGGGGGPPGGGGGPPGGEGRPRPPRTKRELRQFGRRYMYKRQLVTTNCNVATDPTWQGQTCWAFCENPSNGTYDNCAYPGMDITTQGGPTDDGHRFVASYLITAMFVWGVLFFYM